MSENPSTHRARAVPSELYNGFVIASLSRNALDWLMLACTDVTIPTIVIWKHHTGEASPVAAVIVGFPSLVILNAVFLRAIHGRRQRLGQITSRRFISAAAGLALLSGLLTAVGVYSVPERNDYVDLALSNVPLEQIHPERKALLVVNQDLRHPTNVPEPCFWEASELPVRVVARLYQHKRVYRDVRMKELKKVSYNIACFHVVAF
jgi:hypothetical protein